MDLIHEDLEAAAQDLVDLGGVQLGGDAHIVRHIGEEDGDDLALPLEGGAGGEDLLGQEGRGVRVGAGGIEGGGIGVGKVVAAVVAE